MAAASESEDELSSPLFNLTGDNSNRRASLKRPATEALEESENATSYDNLRRLASAAQPVYQRDARTPSSPLHPASSVPSSIGSRLADRTSTSIQNARSIPRPLGRRPVVNQFRRSGGVPTTPHAIRALEERKRVAATPSRERRRQSNRGLERGSPLDLLRALSRVATVPRKPSESIAEEDEEDDQASAVTEESEAAPSINESEESEELPKPPRMSLSMNEMRIEGDDDDDTGVFRPPEMSRLDEEDLTVKSIEGPRRAEVDASVLLRRNRISDFFPSNLDDEEGVAKDGTARRAGSPSFVGGDQSLYLGLEAGDETVDLGQVDSASPRIEQDRDIDLADSTFRFDIPQDVTGQTLDESGSDDEEIDEDGADATIADATVTANATGIAQPAVYDDDSGPEDLGSQRSSEAEDDDTGVFLGADDDYNNPEMDIYTNVEAEDDISNQTISREVEQQLAANDAMAKMQQTRPISQLKSPVQDSTEILSEEEEEDLNVPIPQPLPIRTMNKTTPTRPTTTTTTRIRVAKPVITSKHGQKVPSLPVGVVKTLADSFLPHSGKTSKKVKKDTVSALMQATDWFFEQISEDLDAYSNHADRDTIEESDIVALMRRQRVLATGAKNVQGNRSAAPGASKATLFSLAQRFLPRELITELRMEPPPDEKQKKKRRRISEGDEFD